MLEQYEFAKSLRRLLRRADNFGYDIERLKTEILFIAENNELAAEQIEMAMINQMQKDWMEANQ